MSQQSVETMTGRALDAGGGILRLAPGTRPEPCWRQLRCSPTALPLTQTAQSLSTESKCATALRPSLSFGTKKLLR